MLLKCANILYTNANTGWGGTILADNSIERIREAELGADEILHSAHEEAAKIVERAKKEAELLLRACEDNALARGETRLAAMAQKNERARASASEALGAEIEALSAHMRARQPLAVAALIKAIP